MSERHGEYDPSKYKKPSVTVDLVVMTVRDALLHTLLIRRGEAPFKGSWALPGGFVQVGDGVTDRGESIEAAAYRELEEETGLSGRHVTLDQLHTFGEPDRDPRLRVISVAWCALVRPDLAPSAAIESDAAEARWWPMTDLPPLAFDHDVILSTGLHRIQQRLQLEPIAFELVPETFTIAELRAVHEAILGDPPDRGNFRRGFLRMVADGIVQAAPGKRITSTKPAKVYRFVR